jgi:hypothetical protein
MAAPERRPDEELETLFALVRQRYGARLTPAELEALRQGLEGILAGARAVRAVRLSNADEPWPPFAPFRDEP